MRRALCIVVAMLLPNLAGVASFAEEVDLPLASELLPPGWTIWSEGRSDDEYVPDYEAKNGGKVEWMATQYFDLYERKHQMHTVLAASEDDAKAIAASRAKGHGADFVRRKGLHVFEVVGGDRDLAAKVWSLLGVEEKKAAWQCIFTLGCVDAYGDAATLAEVAELFEKLRWKRQDGELQKAITDRVTGWTFASGLTLPTAAWTLRPGPSSEIPGERFTRYEFGELPVSCTVPYVDARATVTVEARYTPVPGAATDAQRAATKRWPAADPDVVAAAKEAVGEATDPRGKVLSILRSLGKPPRSGLRERCDRFITLCRASGVPARLVGGWRGDLRKPRFWAEVHLTGEGWIPVDPTTVWFGISTRYIPLGVSEDGVLPLLFVDGPRVRR